MADWKIETGPDGQYPQSITLGFKANEAFDSDAAAKWFQRAMNSNDHHEAMSGVIGAAALESKWGSLQKARELLMKVVETGRLDAIFNLGVSLLDEGNLSQAEVYLQKANSPNAQNHVRGAALNALGCLYIEKNDTKTAINYFEQAAEFGEEKSNVNLAALALERGETNIARSWLWEVREKSLDAQVQYANLTHYLIEDLKKPWCFPEQLAERARDFDVSVRRAVAGNETTPKDALERLKEDDDVSVKRIATNTLENKK